MKFEVEIPEKFITALFAKLPDLYENPRNAVWYLITEQLELLDIFPEELDQIIVKLPDSQETMEGEIDV